MRLSVNLTDDDAARLKTLSSDYNLSLTETVRRAIFTESYLKMLHDKHKRVLVEDPETGEFQELVFRSPDRSTDLEQGSAAADLAEPRRRAYGRRTKSAI